MTDHKFADDDVIKALERLREMAEYTPPICHYEKGITEPPFCKPYEQFQNDAKVALALINRQKAMIKRLGKGKKNIKFETGDYAKIAGNKSGHEFEIGTIVKLEKHGEDYMAFANGDYWWVTDDDLVEVDNDTLVKEMTEDLK